MIQFIKVCLWTQVFAFLFALFAFGVLADPRTAGSMTGPVFLMSGAMPLVGPFIRRLRFSHWSFWAALFFTLFFSGPMLFKRFLFYSESFSEITYYGLSSGVFHRLSSGAYLVLFACLVIDLMREKRKKPA